MNFSTLLTETFQSIPMSIYREYRWRIAGYPQLLDLSAPQLA